MVPTTANGTFNRTLYSWTTGQPYFAYENMCLNIPAGATVTMVPGTYIFYNASLSVTGGTIQCVASLARVPPCARGPQGTQGVTIIFMGNPSTNVGNLTISSSAAVNLSAPVSQASFNGTTTLANSSAFGSAYQALNGVLFYRRGQANPATIESAGAPGVNIAGAASTLLNGGMYFPNSYVSYGANGSHRSELFHHRRWLSDPDKPTQPVQLRRLQHQRGAILCPGSADPTRSGGRIA